MKKYKGTELERRRVRVRRFISRIPDATDLTPSEIRIRMSRDETMNDCLDAYPDATLSGIVGCIREGLDVMKRGYSAEFKRLRKNKRNTLKNVGDNGHNTEHLTTIADTVSADTVPAYNSDREQPVGEHAYRQCTLTAAQIVDALFDKILQVQESNYILSGKVDNLTSHVAYLQKKIAHYEEELPAVLREKLDRVLAKPGD